MKLLRLIFMSVTLLLAGCATNVVRDITQQYAQDPLLQKGYRIGDTYVLRKDLFVTEGDWPDYTFTIPGDGVPTVEEWLAGVRKP